MRCGVGEPLLNDKYSCRSGSTFTRSVGYFSMTERCTVLSVVAAVPNGLANAFSYSEKARFRTRSSAQ